MRMENIGPRPTSRDPGNVYVSTFGVLWLERELCGDTTQHDMKNESRVKETMIIHERRSKEILLDICRHEGYKSSYRAKQV